MTWRLAVALTLPSLLIAYVPVQRGIGAEPPQCIYVCRDAGAGGYQAFPDVCRLRSGRLMCIFYASYHHVGLPCPQHPKGGRIAYCISSDEGHSWSKPETLYDGPDDDRDTSIVQLKDGRLVCNFFTIHRTANPSKPCPDPFQEKFTSSGTWIIASNDADKTWRKPQKIYDGYVCSSPIRELSNGRLIMPLYRGTPDVGAVGISDDGGKTWSEPVHIDNGGRSLDTEIDVVELSDGQLWAAQRSSHSPACFAVSTDRGDTWSKSRPLDFVAHSPYLMRTKPSNVILLGYRGYNTLDGAGYGFTALRYSLNKCKTWSKPVVVDAVVGEYPSMVQMKDRSVLIVYYEEGGTSSIRVRRVPGVEDRDRVACAVRRLGAKQIMLSGADYIDNLDKLAKEDMQRVMRSHGAAPPLRHSGLPT